MDHDFDSPNESLLNPYPVPMTTLQTTKSKTAPSRPLTKSSSHETSRDESPKRSWSHCLAEYCNYKTDRHTDLKRHYKTKHPVPQDQGFTCSYKSCTKESKRKDHLRDHCKRVHYRDLPAKYGGTGEKLASRTSSDVGPSSNIGPSSKIQQATDKLDQEMRSLDIAYGGPPEPKSYPYPAESSLERPNNGVLNRANSSNAFDKSSSASLLPQYQQYKPDQVEGPRCLEPGCDGRGFSSYSSLSRHERDKHGLY